MPDRQFIRVSFDIITKKAVFADLVVPAGSDNADIRYILQEYVNEHGLNNVGDTAHELPEGATLESWSEKTEGIHSIKLDFVHNHSEELLGAVNNGQSAEVTN